MKELECWALKEKKVGALLPLNGTHFTAAPFKLGSVERMIHTPWKSIKKQVMNLSSGTEREFQKSGIQSHPLKHT